MQTTKNILLIKPANFGYNSQTASSNSFQHNTMDDIKNIQSKVEEEFNTMKQTLQTHGVNVFCFDDTEDPVKPDAIFPNNWISFHNDGTVIVYPMCAPNRRMERRMDIISELEASFHVSNMIDLSEYENTNRFLEGTGSIVFDHNFKTAYSCLSPRTNKELLIELCNKIGYTPVTFVSVDSLGKEIYHTNVMMSIGNQFAVICTETIKDPKERDAVLHSFEAAQKEVIEINMEQMNHFAGNMLEIKTENASGIVVLSQTAFDSLTTVQINALEQYCTLVPLNIKTIETIGGGSVRCMIAEIFLPERK